MKCRGREAEHQESYSPDLSSTLNFVTQGALRYMGRIRFYATNADRQKAYRRRRKLRAQQAKRVRQNASDPLREVALARFRQDSSKCFQRHIREVIAELDPR